MKLMAYGQDWLYYHASQKPKETFAGKSKYQMFTGNTDVFLGTVS